MSVLTFEMLQRAARMLKAMPVIAPHTHLTHPKRWTDRRVRWIMCALCFAVLDKKRLK